MPVPTTVSSLSIVIPAHNEEAALPETLATLRTAIDRIGKRPVEVVVVDNASDDQTSEIAAGWGAVVVHEPAQSIARARNRGASESNGDFLVFIDADLQMPAHLLTRIVSEMEDPACWGGGCEIRYQPSSRILQSYLWFWRVLGRVMHAVQGSAQFITKDAFAAVGGYDESLWMGEDVDFFWRMRRAAKQAGGSVLELRDAGVVGSSRRFDTWPVHRVLFYTNPLVIWLLQHRRAAWSGWYEDPPRTDESPGRGA